MIKTALITMNRPAPSQSRGSNLISHIITKAQSCYLTNFFHLYRYQSKKLAL